MKQIRLFSGFFTVGFWTLASRILGFLREILLTAYIGPGPVMDAFVAAFRLPNMFRRFFAEGAFNAAFVPMFSKRLEGGENARRVRTGRVQPAWRSRAWRWSGWRWCSCPARLADSRGVLWR